MIKGRESPEKAVAQGPHHESGREKNEVRQTLLQLFKDGALISQRAHEPVIRDRKLVGKIVHKIKSETVHTAGNRVDLTKMPHERKEFYALNTVTRRRGK